MLIPRVPTDAEVRAIKALVAAQMGVRYEDEAENIDGWVANAAIAVFDGYVTDSPCYAGRVITVVWPASPTIYEVFTFDRNGNLERMEQEG